MWWPIENKCKRITRRWVLPVRGVLKTLPWERFRATKKNSGTQHILTMMSVVEFRVCGSRTRMILGWQLDMSCRISVHKRHWVLSRSFRAVQVAVSLASYKTISLVALLTLKGSEDRYWALRLLTMSFCWHRHACLLRSSSVTCASKQPNVLSSPCFRCIRWPAGTRPPGLRSKRLAASNATVATLTQDAFDWSRKAGVLPYSWVIEYLIKIQVEPR